MQQCFALRRKYEVTCRQIKIAFSSFGCLFPSPSFSPLTNLPLTSVSVHCQFNGKRLPPIYNMIANHLGPAPCILLFPRRHKHPRSFTASDVFISPRSATADPETCRIFNSILLDPSSPRRGTVAYRHTDQAFSTSTTLGSTFRSAQTRLGCG